MSPPRKPAAGKKAGKPAPAAGVAQQEPVPEAYQYTDPDAGHIGHGATGNLDGYPECPLCFAHGGGGHGSNCPNAGKDPADWIPVLPEGWAGPERETA